MAVDAGFVPWAESGTSTFFRGLPSRSRWNARIIRTPVSSPCAPAAGWSEAASIPTISASISPSSPMSWRAPCAASSGVRGWSRANPGRRAMSSLSLGLYFMVHEPSG